MTAITASSTELAAAFEQEAQRLMDEFKVPGVSMALMLPDGDHFLCFGVTSIDNPLPVTDDTIFQIGSITKTLTSLTLSALAEQGKLNITDRVRDHIPDFKMKDTSVAGNLTILDVLTHQGGFQGDFFQDTGEGDDALARVVDAVAALPQVVPMRTHWSYSNAGFYIAGRVIELVSGLTYEAAVTELVLKPLGMDHTFFSANEVMTYRFATGYNKVGDKMVVQRPWLMMRSGGPAGSTCCSSARDLVKYLHYMLSGRLAPQEAADDENREQPPLATLDRARLWTAVREIGPSTSGPPGTQRRIGQSWFLDQSGGALLISHGGSTLGHQSNLWVSPDRQVGFVSLTNAPNGHAMNQKLSEWVKHEVLGLSESPAADLNPGEAELQPLLGYYSVIGQAQPIATTLQQGRLVVTLPDGSPSGRDLPVRFIAPDHAVVVGGDADGISVEFLREDGEVRFMRLGLRLCPRQSGAQHTGAPQSGGQL
ncbi:serine hydrolase domain-containing protein [Deinococcus alpinitundrae]|uniref:serine hydrolase domain-containing protein n=1 Tax=Deinococcus alpinitundrae TaxID=468913 RepID=UPI00137B0BAF|nr:serine hydrolase domain-containing protein [Deinococcus alpinitundrae]